MFAGIRPHRRNHWEQLKMTAITPRVAAFENLNKKIV